MRRSCSAFGPAICGEMSPGYLFFWTCSSSQRCSVQRWSFVLSPLFQSNNLLGRPTFWVGLPAALANGIVVTWRAEAIAGDRPYCIQYASQTDAFAYEPARTLFDISALKMRQRQGKAAGLSGAWIVWQDHGVLIIADTKLSFLTGRITKKT